MNRYLPNALTKNILLRDVAAGDLPTFCEQQLDSDANFMAAFTARDPADRDVFTAHWARTLGDKTIGRPDFDTC